MAGFCPEKSLRAYGGGPARDSHPVVYHPIPAVKPKGHLKRYSFDSILLFRVCFVKPRKGNRGNNILKSKPFSVLTKLAR